MLTIDRELDLDRLLERCRKGNCDSWQQVVDTFQRLVYSIPKRMGLTDSDCEEVFQATFIALYRNLYRIESAQALPKWLGVTASREALRIKRLSDKTVQMPATEAGSLEELLAAEEQSAEEMAVESSKAFELRKGIERVGGKCRELLEILYLGEEEGSYAEVSDKMGMPIGSIGPTKARCLDKLRKILESENFFAL